MEMAGAVGGEEEEEKEEEEEEEEEEEGEEVHPQALLSTLGTAMSLGSPTSHTVPQRGRGLAKILHSDWPTLNGKTNVPTLQDKMQPVKPCRWSLTDVYVSTKPSSLTAFSVSSSSW